MRQEEGERQQSSCRSRGRLAYAGGECIGSMMRWESAGRTDLGLVRETNEDALLVAPERGLYAVADGMGGHAAGEVASRMAIEVLDRSFAGAPAPATAEEAVARLRPIFAGASAAILERGTAEREKQGMGTTMTVLVQPRLDAPAVLGHMGDSRAYLLHAGELRQLTRDHTWVQEKVAEGTLTPQQAREHPFRNVLTRVLGAVEPGEADVLVQPLVPGDVVVLCSDGLSGMVDDADLAAILAQDLPAEVLADQLVGAARLRGGYDNITAVVVRAL